MDRFAQGSTISLSYVLFYEKGEGEVGPRLVPQEQEGE
jgi:hypothetical protein